jgi:hypothetical protein
VKRGQSSKRIYCAVPIGPVSRLAQGQEPGQPCDAAGTRGDVVTGCHAPRGTDMRVSFRQLRTYRRIRSAPLWATCRLTQCSEHRHQREPSFPYNHHCDRVR